MQLCELVATSAQVAASPGRKAKITAIADLLARVPPDEVPIAVAFLSGDLTQRQIGVGYAALMDLSPPDQPNGQADAEQRGPAEPVLTLRETDDTFEAIGAMLGPGSQAQRRAALAGLIGRATETERQFLFRLIAGELHQGALEGVMIEAVALAAGAPAAEVRRANQLRGSLPQVAQAALGAAAASTAGGSGGSSPRGSTAAGNGTGPDGVVEVLRGFTLAVGQPIKPMLAASAPNVETALGKISPAALDWKIDGIRIQIHRQGQQVRVFTRTLDDITERLPEIVTIALGLDVESVVIDAEAIALRPDGRPHPFQITSARAASQLVDGKPVAGVPLTAFMFDLLHLNGADLIDEPATERFDELTAIVPPELLIPRLVTADPDEAAAFFAEAIAKGHEGLVVKSTDAPYQTGRRGSDWIKVKPRTTLDLVILAAEWGHGRRTGLLSNLHLGARDPDTGKFVMLGKTFKGLTDAMLRWQTDHLLELADPPDQPDVARPYGVVRVRPELVAEIAFDGVQASKRYPGGVTLRFARVLRYRDDKQAAEADTIGMVQALWDHNPEEPEG
ncbi:MAG TPA: ATP-dependent DNA ligase [Streptosporangiaceae bacterium]|nr:ATP-dependent DNA ligase [Streptosporangiaceae bacterium]